MSAPAIAFTARHVQLGRAALAAIAALMITFSADHSAQVGLAVFSGFGVATAIVLFLAAWLAARAGGRWHYVLLGAITLLAGMIAGVPPLRTDEAFFAIVISWALVCGLVELLVGIRLRSPEDSLGRDHVTVGAISMLLGVALLIVPPAFSVGYTVDNDSFTLTGIILGVGILGAYAAIVAVYLAIAGLSPRRPQVASEAPAATDTGGAA